MNELQKVKQFHVWESTYDLYDWSKDVPEVAGNPINNVIDGVLISASSKVPKPKCKKTGYSTWEWLLHWKNTFKQTVLGVSPKEIMQDYKRMLDAR